VRRNLKALSVLVFVFLASFVILSGQKASAAMVYSAQLPIGPPPSPVTESGKITGCYIDISGHTHITGYAETSIAGWPTNDPQVRLLVWRSPKTTGSQWFNDLGTSGLNVNLHRDSYTNQTYAPTSGPIGFDYNMSSFGESLTQGDDWLIAGYAFLSPLGGGPAQTFTPLGILNNSSFPNGFINNACKTPPTTAPFGQVTSCSLDSSGHLVIKGWAYDDDQDTYIAPMVTLSIDNLTKPSIFNGSRAVETDIESTVPERTYIEAIASGKIPSQFNGTAPFRNTYMFIWTYSGNVYDDNNYVVHANVENYGGGPDVPLTFPSTFGPYAAAGLGVLDNTWGLGCRKPRPPKDFGTPPLVNPAADCGVVITCPDNPKLTEAETNTITVPTTTLSTTSTSTVIKLILTLAGGVALIVIFVAGFRFVISQGNPDATVKARNTIVYALIGLVIITLAYNIVTFVLLRL